MKAATASGSLASWARASPSVTCALMICADWLALSRSCGLLPRVWFSTKYCGFLRSEEHTSELQSQSNLVCRLLLEKKKKRMMTRVLDGINSQYYNRILLSQ